MEREAYRRVLQAESSQPPLPHPTHCPLQSRDFSVSLTGVVWSRRGGGLKSAPEVQLVLCSCSMRASPASLGWRPDGDRPSCCHCPPCPAQGGPESRASPLSQLQLQGRSGAEGTPSLARCRGDRATGIVSSSSYGITVVPHSCPKGSTGLHARCPCERKPLSAAGAL